MTIFLETNMIEHQIRKCSFHIITHKRTHTHTHPYAMCFMYTVEFVTFSSNITQMQIWVIAEVPISWWYHVIALSLFCGESFRLDCQHYWGCRFPVIRKPWTNWVRVWENAVTLWFLSNRNIARSCKIMRHIEKERTPCFQDGTLW